VERAHLVVGCQAAVKASIYGCRRAHNSISDPPPAYCKNKVEIFVVGLGQKKLGQEEEAS
jgi:hypothetical protein